MKLKALVLALITAIILICPFNAYALDNNYIESLEYWYDKSEPTVLSEDNFECIVRYVLDEGTGCAYFYFQVLDESLINADRENICFEIQIANETNNYTLTFVESGLKDEALTAKIIRTQYAFKGFNLQLGYCEACFGIELLSRDDRSTENTITAVYYSGNSGRKTLIDKATFNLKKPEKTTQDKATSSKATTSKTTKPATLTTRQSTSTTKPSSTKVSNSRASTQTLTKFVPTNPVMHKTTAAASAINQNTSQSSQSKPADPTASSAQWTSSGVKPTSANDNSTVSTRVSDKSVSKFVPDNKYSVTKQDNDTSSAADSIADRVTNADSKIYTNSNNPTDTPEVSGDSTGASLSPTAKAGVASAAAVFTAGTAFIIISIFKGKLKTVKDE